MYIYRLKRNKAWLVEAKTSFQPGCFPTVDTEVSFQAKQKQFSPSGIGINATSIVLHPSVHATNSLNTSGKVGVSKKYISAHTGEHLGWIAYCGENNKQKNDAIYLQETR